MRIKRETHEIIAMRLFIPLLVSLSWLLTAAASEIDLLNPSQGVWEENWFIQKINGQKVGYSHYVVEREGDLIRTRNQQLMRIGRLGEGLEIRSEQFFEETIGGEPVSFRVEQAMGVEPQVIEGRIEGGQLRLSRSQYGQTAEREVEWDDNVLLPWALIRRFAGVEMAEGLEFEVLVLYPDLRDEGGIPVHILVEGQEQMEWQGEPVQTWKMQQTLKHPSGMSIETVSWMSDEGRLYRSVSRMGIITMEITRSSSEEALADFVGPELFEDSLIKVKGSYGIEDAEAATYRVTSKVEMGEVFPETTDQQVTRIGEQEWEIRVKPHQLNPEDMRIQGGPEAAVEYTEPNFYLNYEDKAVVKLTEELESLRDLSRIERARELTRWVHGYIAKKNYDIGFATASEVARIREGDCTEHAVLLAALGRALGLPSRVASGLVLIPGYTEGEEGIMGFHMWTQFYFEGQWFDYDAALAPENTPPTRILIADSSLQKDVLFDMGVKISELMGKIEIEVTELGLAENR